MMPRAAFSHRRSAGPGLGSTGGKARSTGRSEPPTVAPGARSTVGAERRPVAGDSPGAPNDGAVARSGRERRRRTDCQAVRVGATQRTARVADVHAVRHARTENRSFHDRRTSCLTSFRVGRPQGLAQIQTSSYEERTEHAWHALVHGSRVTEVLKGDRNPSGERRPGVQEVDVHIPEAHAGRDGSRSQYPIGSSSVGMRRGGSGCRVSECRTGQQEGVEHTSAHCLRMARLLAKA